MRKLLSFLFCLSIFFPYIQFVKNESYNQPYAFFLSLIIVLINYKTIRKKLNPSTFNLLLSFLFLGTFFFIFTCFPYKSQQEYKYLLIYISVPLISIATFYTYHIDKKLLVSVCKASVYIWLITGLIQTFYDSSFLTFLVGDFGLSHEVLGPSGRGVLGLAPEPTHYGFHMLFLAACLLALRLNDVLIWVCIFQALILAMSSSALMALSFGIVFYLFFHKISLVKSLFLSVTMLLFIFFQDVLFSSLKNLEDSSRAIYLTTLFLENPTLLIELDYSANNRLGGTIATFKLIIEDFFLPHGMSHQTWMDYREILFLKNKWLFALSESGAPSGIGLLVFQSGFLIIPSLFMVFRKIITKNINAKKLRWISYAAIFAMLNQLMLSTPIFCFLIGLSISNFNEDY